MSFKRISIDEAKALIERAVAMAERTRGPDHPYMVDFLSKQASILMSSGLYREARPVCERALIIVFGMILAQEISKVFGRI